MAENWFVAIIVFRMNLKWNKVEWKHDVKIEGHEAYGQCSKFWFFILWIGIVCWMRCDISCDVQSWFVWSICAMTGVHPSLTYSYRVLWMLMVENAIITVVNHILSQQWITHTYMKLFGNQIRRICYFFFFFGSQSTPVIIALVSWFHFFLFLCSYAQMLMLHLAANSAIYISTSNTKYWISIYFFSDADQLRGKNNKITFYLFILLTQQFQVVFEFLRARQFVFFAFPNSHFAMTIDFTQHTQIGEK